MSNVFAGLCSVQEESSAAVFEEFRSQSSHLPNVSLEQAVALYASISAVAAEASADALILALCRYRSDPGTGLWLKLLMQGKVASQLLERSHPCTKTC